ncbi:MAG TPA: sugar transferase, partial [Anaerolineales bacterium]|nr:sugar transferase [Anaerolineales bacterium]
GESIAGDLQSLGRVAQLSNIVERYQIGELILATSSFSTRDHMTEIFRQYGADKNIRVRFSSGLYEIMTTGLKVQDFAYVPLVGINPVRLTGFDQFLKVLLDYSAVSIGMIFALPLMAVIALAVRLDSPGPIIHRRRVMGVRGKQFDAFKFRTMYVNGDEILAQYPKLMAELKATQKLKNDPRVTRIGKILRKLSLDELPQIFNVLRGEMSLVGPRMISPGEIELYDRWDMNLLTVRPGITGLWQVSGRSDVSYNERVQMDMRYIRNWSIWQDIQILIQTIPAVIKSRGAY